MILPLTLSTLLGGISLFVVVIGARVIEAKSWRAHLTAYRLTLPNGLSADDAARWLTNVSGLTHPPLWSLFPMPPVGLEIVASASRGITYYLLTASNNEAQVLSGLRSSLPGIRLDPAPDYLDKKLHHTIAAELGMTSYSRQLSVDRAEAVNSAVLSSLLPLVSNEEIRLQWLITGAGTPKPLHSASTKKGDRSWSGYLFEGDVPADVEALRALRLKQQDAQILATARIGISAPSKARAYKLLGRVWGNFHGANAVGVRVVRRWIPSSVVANRLSMRKYPVTKWPLVLGAHEAAALIPFPTGGAVLPGISLGSARQLPPTTTAVTYGAAILGASNYPAMTDRLLTISAEDRTRHLYVVGPSGSGKSVLLTRLILGDIQSGFGVIAIDPKGDMIPDVLARIDEKDADRVLVIDASKRERPIGFNPLGTAQTEEEQELAVDGILTVFKEIWSSFWGPRSDAILRASLSTLVRTRAADGSPFTICELVPLLTEPAFRRYVVSRPGLPDNLKAYWQRYEALSDGAREQAIAPLLNKLEAFTSRTPIRLMLGQATGGLNFSDVFMRRRVVLISLAQGSLGEETAALLGSLLTFSMWQAALKRVNTPPEKRFPVFGYIDEAQAVVKLPVPLPDMLAQARGFKFGLTLANQYLYQLSDAVQAAVMNTVRNQVAFHVEDRDAHLLERRFAPLTADDLQGLAAWEIAIRPSVNGGTGAVVTGMSLPLPEATADPEQLATASRTRYGLARADVEASLTARLQVPTRRAGFGVEHQS
ncbi:MAG TPA: type IV secretory system conjugative DNA transfer family protein [Actinocrinis sp.]|nr:type IV secretory system conjugative DNA transfer family protein [Actinocrinis sp.]